MAGEWRKLPLSAVAELSGGFAFKSRDYVSAGRFVLRTLNIRDDCSISREDGVFLPEELWPEYSRFELQPDDTLFVMVGATLGKIGYVRSSDLPALLNQNMWRIRAKPGIADARFIHYAFRLAVKSSLAWASGSARDFVRRDDYRNLEIFAPSLIEQEAVGAVLGALDEKIQLNRRMNETLEGMARAVFKSWFIDFDPVRAKAEGCDTNLPKALADMFPNTFQSSDAGDVPHGWRLVPLPDAIEVNPSRSLRRGDVAPYLDMANMPTRGHAPASVIDRPFGSGMRFSNGDTLVARITPCLENGKTAYVDFLESLQIGWGSTEYIVLRPKEPLPPEYAYFLARSDPFREFAIQSMTGSSGRQRVPAEALTHFRVVVPSEQIAAEFGKFATPLVARMSAAAKQSRILGTQRDTLLPKLVSGELRLPDVERIIGGQI
jgi:type I restriction enzyme S subunit